MSPIFSAACRAFLVVAYSVTVPAFCAAQGDIRMPAVFSDKMVLQQGTEVNVWGSASPGEALTVTLGEASASATADDSGQWSTRIAAPPAGGPYELVVAGANARVIFTDVLVGEVWICSGQSNMEWSLEQSVDITEPEALHQYLASISDPGIRLLTVPRSAVEEPAAAFAQPASWTEATPDTVRTFSATAYFFARSLRESPALQNVPIGLIHSSWGGTPGEAWTPMPALEKQESLAPLLSQWKDNAARGLPDRPANLFNGMIAPLIPYSIRGVIWYQGEANVGRAEQYETILTTLISSWRELFGQGNFPFYLVQLAPFRYPNHRPDALAEIWNVQRKMLAVPNVGVAGSSDIGNPDDIHPRNKQEVGRRLALIARNTSYGENTLVYSGPVYRSHAPVAGTGALEIEFDHAIGMCLRESPVSGFEVCGEDGVYVPAQAAIHGDRVRVSAREVPQPVGVRYLSSDTSSGTLFNASGLPALPFQAGR